MSEEDCEVSIVTFMLLKDTFLIASDCIESLFCDRLIRFDRESPPGCSPIDRLLSCLGPKKLLLRDGKAVSFGGGVTPKPKELCG